MEEIEVARKKALNKTIKCIIITIIMFIISILFIQPFAVFALIIGVILIAVVPAKDTKKFKKIYKKNIVIETFNSMFKDVSFDLEHGIPRSVLQNTNMISTGDVYSSNDYVKARFKNINFELSDVHIQDEYTDSDGHTQYTTIFKGQWYIFDFNKRFKANVQVCEKFFGADKRGGLFSGTKYKKVSLEDIEFNKQFKVYAQNEIDAFYILSPTTMERIKKINNTIKGKLLFCFIDNRLHIGLYNNKDLFEASIFKKVDLDIATKKTKEEISIITDFIDILNLDNDLFIKEGGEVWNY